MLYIWQLLAHDAWQQYNKSTSLSACHKPEHVAKFNPGKSTHDDANVSGYQFLPLSSYKLTLEVSEEPATQEAGGLKSKHLAQLHQGMQRWAPPSWLCLPSESLSLFWPCSKSSFQISSFNWLNNGWMAPILSSFGFVRVIGETVQHSMPIL
jgi:hypothetical protein